MSLYSRFRTHQGKIIHKWEHYFPIYERHLQAWQNKTCTFIEIGVSKGGSLQMWKDFLGPLATVVGIDINPECKSHEVEGVHIRIGDQSDTAFLSKIIEEFGSPDIVIDDGSHEMGHLSATFEYLYPQLSKNGVYLAEDLHTCFWEEYGGGVDKQENFLSRTKPLIDALNADHSRGAIPTSFFSKHTFGIHYYDSVVVFERGTIPTKSAPMFGKEENSHKTIFQKLIRS